MAKIKTPPKKANWEMNLMPTCNPDKREAVAIKVMLGNGGGGGGGGGGGNKVNTKKTQQQKQWPPRKKTVSTVCTVVSRHRYTKAPDKHQYRTTAYPQMMANNWSSGV
jgi:hypothetical protein|tara:strand:+ start:448 stop:771 length:324 start_codon:yes stop_codon:yes gene_type:complete